MYPRKLPQQTHKGVSGQMQAEGSPSMITVELMLKYELKFLYNTITMEFLVRYKLEDLHRTITVGHLIGRKLE